MTAAEQLFNEGFAIGLQRGFEDGFARGMLIVEIEVALDALGLAGIPRLVLVEQSITELQTILANLQQP